MDKVYLEIGGGTNRSHYSTHVIDPTHPYTSTQLSETLLKRFAQETPWPFYDNQVDGIYASHVMEHIPSGESRIKVFNEAWRVIKPGGNFDIVVPLVGWTDNEGTGRLVNGWYPYADPTHVSFWWFPESLLYFCEGDFKPHADYNIKLWTLASWHVQHGYEGVARLNKYE